MRKFGAAVSGVIRLRRVRLLPPAFSAALLRHACHAR